MEKLGIFYFYYGLGVLLGMGLMISLSFIYHKIREDKEVVIFFENTLKILKIFLWFNFFASILGTMLIIIKIEILVIREMAIFNFVTIIFLMIVIKYKEWSKRIILQKLG